MPNTIDKKTRNINLSKTHMLILASASDRRRDLLANAGIEVDGFYPADIDEEHKKGEKSRELVKRLADDKARHVFELAGSDENIRGCFILAADTVVSVGSRILQKPENIDEARRHLKLLSGRSHRVYSGVCVYTPEGLKRVRVVETRVKFKRLSLDEIEVYLKKGEWQGKAGSYAIQGLAGNFVIRIIGSYSSVVGLPLYETINLLTGMGYPVYKLMK